MQNFQNIDSNTFKLNGVKYVKNFLAIKQGSTNISVVNAYDTSFQLLGSTHFSQVSIDGLTYSSQSALMNALATILFAKQIVDVAGVVTSLTGFTDIYPTGGTYSNGTAIITNNQGASFSISGFTKPQNLQDVTDLNNESTNSLRVIDSSDSNFFGELKKNQILLHTSTGGGVGINADNSTEYYRLQAPNKIGGTDRTIATTDDLIVLTGGTYSNGSLTLRNNTGGTFSVSGFSTGTTTPSLQEVTETGSKTTIGIAVKNNLDNNITANIYNDEENVGILSIRNPSDNTSIQVLSDRFNFAKNVDYSYWFRPNTSKPSGDYILATTDDLTGFTGAYVPYTGATQDVNLGSNTITSSGFITPITTTGSLNITKGNIGGYDSFIYQSISDITGDNFGTVNINANPEEGISLSKQSPYFSEIISIYDGGVYMNSVNNDNGIGNSIEITPTESTFQKIISGQGGFFTNWGTGSLTIGTPYPSDLAQGEILFSDSGANDNFTDNQHVRFGVNIEEGFTFNQYNTGSNVNSYIGAANGIVNLSTQNGSINNQLSISPSKVLVDKYVEANEGFKTTSGVTAHTISATTYYNLPLNIYTTGGTYSNGSLSLKNNTGGTVSISGLSTGYTLTKTAITSTLGYTPVSDLQYRNGGFTLFDDMHTAGSNQSPFLKANINSGTQSQAASLTTVNNSGAIQIFASTTTNSGGFIGFVNSTSPASFYLTAGQQFDTIVIFDSFFSGTTTRCGILNGTNTSADATNGCYFEIVNDQLIGKSASGSVRSTTSAYTLSLNTWYHLRVKVTSLSLITYSLFDMAGNQLWTQTLTTNIPPSNSSTLLQPALITTSTIGSSSRLLTIDYIAITYPQLQRGALN